MRTLRDVKRDAARLWRLCLANGHVDARRAHIVCDRLVDTHRPVPPAVVSSFCRMLRREAARHLARVESAVPLDASSCETIDVLLAERYGDGITTTFAVDPALLGGIRITVGSDVYDDSVRARLVALDERFADLKVRAANVEGPRRPSPDPNNSRSEPGR